MNHRTGVFRIGLLVLLTGFTSFGRTETARLIRFQGGVEAKLSFLRGPYSQPSEQFETIAVLEVHSPSPDANHVRGVTFDATRVVGRHIDALSSRNAPVAVPFERPNTWQIRNIFFTMDRKWEGKLTLEFDDGTAETQRFVIDVRAA